MSEEDIRITKSREAIVKAMETLLEQKPFRKITVNDLCRTAVVGRTTFYAHFEDKYKLISYILQQEQQGLETILLSDSPPEELILEVLLDIRGNKKLYHNLFVAEASDELEKLLQDTFTSFLPIYSQSARQKVCNSPVVHCRLCSLFILPAWSA